MVVIRLARSGSKKKPFYHIVVAHKHSKRDGRFVERIGFFNPVARGKDPKVRLNRDRVAHWIDNGAQLSQRVKTLVKQWDASPQEMAETA